MSRHQALAHAALGVLLLWLTAGPGHAATITRTVSFGQPVVTYDAATSAVNVDRLPTVGNPGQPLLPAYTLEVLLPQGERLTGVSAVASREEEVPVGLPLEWADEQWPLSVEAPGRRTQPDPAIYDRAGVFPAGRAAHVTTETFRGYNIAYIRLYPVVYDANRGVLLYAPALEVAVETASSAELRARSVGTMRRGSSRDRLEVRRMVEDVSALDSYADSHPFPNLATAMQGIVNPADTYPYVIITNVTLKPVFETLKQHKDERGLRTKIVLLGEIGAYYTGADLAAKIRNFITDAYLNWETEYVLLGADNEILPHRGLYAASGSYQDQDIASDLYYAALDGNWNTDGDAYWGEPNEADLIPEVSVGRAAVSTTAEATNFVNKIIKYEDSPVTGQIETGQMVGELLWIDPTWGCDYKDEIKNGSSAHGYTTVGFPGSFTVGTLYDRDMYPDQWDKEDLIPLLNGGRHLVNHLGHTDVASGLRMNNSDIETRFTNDGVQNTYFVLYTQGCYAGSFDNRNSGGGYVDDCLGEHFTFVENAAVAFIGNTRYGWGTHLSTRGSSQYFDRQFFDAIFGENITAVGRANDDSRVDNIPYIDFMSIRWVYYELALLGDPSMDIWTDTPGELLVDHPEVIYVAENEVPVAVASGGSPVAGARVSLFTDTTYACGYTDASGTIYIDPGVHGPASLRVAVSAHNYLAYLDTVEVVSAERPLIVIDGFEIDDDSQGGSAGNSDGKIDAGETIESIASLKNIGSDSARAVWAELGEADPYVATISDSGSFGDIPPGAVATPSWSYVYGVSPSAPDGHEIEFWLDIGCSDTTVVRHRAVLVSAPDLRATDIAFDDSAYGNGDGCIEPGEGIELSVVLANAGSGDGEGVSVVLSESDPYVAIGVDSVYVPSVPAGEDAEFGPYFLTLTPDCPEFHQIELGLAITFASGRQATESVAVYVGGSLSEDFEGGAQGWVHVAPVEGYYDEWRLQDYMNHTPGGSRCWKYGGADSLDYSDYSYGALATPELCLGAGASLTFWHWMRAELNTGDYSWDGGIVEISTDGGETWSQITPVGGYPYRIYPNQDSPFEPNTPCFAWNDWTQVGFDLSAYQGPTRIRFVFGSDAYYTQKGWYIDDVVITDDDAAITLEDGDLQALPAEFALGGVSPNPLMRGGVVRFDVPRRSRVSIEVFDVSGKAVRTLVDGVLEPGRHSRTVDLDKTLASGVYFISMHAHDFSQTKKLILVR